MRHLMPSLTDSDASVPRSPAQSVFPAAFYEAPGRGEVVVDRGGVEGATLAAPCARLYALPSPFGNG